MVLVKFDIFFVFFLFIECESGMFGFDCNEICGNCEYMEYCYYVIGFCMYGCNFGYYGLCCIYE